jgi:hypothetical protein
MKTLTNNLIKFALVATISAVIFRYAMTYGIEIESKSIILFFAFLYAVVLFISGWIFGKKDREYMPIYDVGFRFHLTTYLTYNIISELWFVLGFNSKTETASTVHTTAIIWGFYIIVHFIWFLWSRKNSINNLAKKDLFD